MRKKKQKILIFEGIATSGKTTLLNLIKERSEDKIIKIVEEDETLMPILHNTNRDVAVEHLKVVLNDNLKLDFDILIFDRLYFTHIFRTNSTTEDFKETEEKLNEFNCSLVFLKIDENKILKRIKDAMKHREQSWVEYVKSKGDFEDIEQYYINQQQELEKLVKYSQILNYEFNSTKNDFEKIIKEFLEE